MTNKKKSFFKQMMDTVSKLPWLKKPSVSMDKQNIPDENFNKSVPNPLSNLLNEIDDHEFEQLVHDVFKQRGYSVAEKREGAYEGADIILLRSSESTYVQYQYWKEQVVDVTAIGELYVAMEVDGIKHGIVITSGEFTPEALDFSLGKSLMLINGADLAQMIEALPPTAEKNIQTESEKIMETPSDTAQQEMPELEPLCPICSQKMIKRTAKKGKNAGNTFWGCSKFPGCRGVVSI